MKITVGKYSGFCFGVKAALKEAERYAKEGASCLGEIIHNERVVNSLVRKGLKIVSSPDEVKDGKIIIRSHGVGKDVYDKIAEKGLALIDATCPFVKKIHEIAKKYDSLGYRVVIIGKRNHPEVVGIGGWCQNGADVVESVEELETYLETAENDKKLCFVAQTTFSKKKI